MPRHHGSLSHRLRRLEEAERRLRARRAGGGGRLPPGVFGQPWRPLTAEEQAAWDANTTWLLATADRVERGEVSEEESDAIEVRTKRLVLRDDAEREKMRTASEAMEGGGSDHGRAVMAERGCGCGACFRWRKANGVDHPPDPSTAWRSPEHLVLWRKDDEERALRLLMLPPESGATET